MCITLHLLTLNLICHHSAHSRSLFRSFLKFLTISLVLTDLNNFVLSAQSSIFFLIPLFMPLIKVLNNAQLGIEP